MSTDPFTSTLVDTAAVSLAPTATAAAPPARTRAADQLTDEPLYFGLSLTAWLKVGILTVLMAATFWINLRHLYLKTNPFTGEANWGHSVVIPIIGIYYLYLHREELRRARKQPLLLGRFTKSRVISSLVFLISGAGVYRVLNSAFIMNLPVMNKLSGMAGYVQALGLGVAILGGLALLLDWGLATTIFGLFSFAYGIWPGQNDFVRDLGTVITLFGVVLMICGWDVMRIVWFPIVFLVVAVPWPGLVYSAVAGPLQELAAHVSVGVLNLTGVESQQIGTKIVMHHLDGTIRTLNVAEACAGLKSLMTFISIGAGLAFVFGKDRPLWQKLIITASAVPIAILCDVMRVAGQGLLDYYVSPELSEGFAHQIAGLVMLIPAFFMVLGVAWVLDQIFVEEVDLATVKPAGPAVIRRQRRVVGQTSENGATPQAAGAPAAVVGDAVPRRNLPRRLPPQAQRGAEGA